MLLTSFCLYSTQKISTNLSKYFPSVDCEELKKDEVDDPKMMEEYAHLEWYWFKTMNENHITVEEISTSNLHCYCDEQREKLGTWQASQIKAEKEGNGKVPKVKGYLCRDYLYYD